MHVRRLAALAVIVAALVGSTHACTTVLATPGANASAGLVLQGCLPVFPGANAFPLMPDPSSPCPRVDRGWLNNLVSLK